jgi:2-C-methyl-D-erythritol 2,4-cyclodiphosphate synthase
VRAGFGVDAHAFGGPGPLVLSGIVVARERGVEATSDGDVVAHAVADAVLGAAALGDLGEHFPSSDPSSQGADSMAMLRSVVDRIANDGLSVANVDVTVVAQSVKVAPHRAAMRAALAGVLGVEIDVVSVKATTTDSLGFVGNDEGIACYAVVVLE